MENPLTMLQMHKVIPVTEVSHVGQVRRALQELATRTRLPEETGGRALLVATEMCTNLVKHSTCGGEILFRAIPEEHEEPAGLEIFSIDKGRGIPNIARAFHDGFSTAGSPGTGLGAIQRMSDTMEIFSGDQLGVVIAVQIRQRGIGRKFLAPRIRTIFRPLDGFDISGDYGLVIRKGHHIYFLMADGLGHGEEAAEASRMAGATFKAHFTAELPALMTLIHKALVKTRGAAVAVARYDTSLRTLNYVGVGNIESRICTDTASQGCATFNGTAGIMLPKLLQFDYTVAPGAVFVMHTDGLSTRWNLRDYPGLSFHSPGAIAGVLFRDFSRRRDDASILVFTT